MQKLATQCVSRHADMPAPRTCAKMERRRVVRRTRLPTSSALVSPQYSSLRPRETRLDREDLRAEQGGDGPASQREGEDVAEGANQGEGPRHGLERRHRHGSCER